MKRLVQVVFLVLSLAAFASAQHKRLWVLGPSGEMVEYDSSTLAMKQAIKVPTEAFASPQGLEVNRAGQMLFAAPLSLPFSEGDLAAGKKVWLWNGHATATLTRDVSRATATAGSNLAITESDPAPYLSAEGTHLYWFGNQARRLQRDGVDLSLKDKWLSWRTELDGGGREDLASIAMPDCSCPTGGCEETCAYGEVWVPEDGVGSFFLVNQNIAGQTRATYKSSAIFANSAGKWAATQIDPPLRRVLDAAGVDAILEAVPDTGCCGWSNESNDQTLLRFRGKTLTVFDERNEYKNPDYDVSFYTENGKLSPDLVFVAVTIAATTPANTPIQLAEEGQANPEESQHIRKALLDLPAVEIKRTDEPLRRIAFLPHATLVGWISDKEILIVEGHLLVAYNVASGTRQRSNLRVEDAAHVFLR